MKEDKILFIDTETGGIDPSKYSLLSIGLVVWCNHELIAPVEFFINDGKLKANKEALAINKIDLNLHKKNSQPSDIILKQILIYLEQHFVNNEKITLAGHNVNFDVNFLKYFFEKNNYDFSKYFSHRFIDTSSILYYLYLSGKLNYRTFSSSDAFTYFGIEVSNRHTALGDAIATAKLFSRLIQITHKTMKVDIDKYKDQYILPI